MAQKTPKEPSGMIVVNAQGFVGSFFTLTYFAPFWYIRSQQSEFLQFIFQIIRFFASQVLYTFLFRSGSSSGLELI